MRGLNLQGLDPGDREFIIRCRPTRLNIDLDSYTLVDVFASLDVTENFTVGASVQNLFDELAVYDGIGTFQDPESIIAAQPRTFSINGRYRF